MLSVSDIEIGRETHPMTHKGQRMGPFLLSADNLVQLHKNIEIVKNTLHIDVEDKNGIIRGIIWT